MWEVKSVRLGVADCLTKVHKSFTYITHIHTHVTTYTHKGRVTTLSHILRVVISRSTSLILGTKDTTIIRGVLESGLLENLSKKLDIESLVTRSKSSRTWEIMCCDNEFSWYTTGTRDFLNYMLRFSDLMTVPHYIHHFYLR